MLAEIASVAKGMFSEFKCDLHGISTMFGNKIEKMRFFMSLFCSVKSLSELKVLLFNSGKYFPAVQSLIFVNFHFNLFL